MPGRSHSQEQGSALGVSQDAPKEEFASKEELDETSRREQEDHLSTLNDSDIIILEESASELAGTSMLLTLRRKYKSLPKCMVWLPAKLQL